MCGSFSQPNGHVLVKDYGVGDSAQVRTDMKLLVFSILKVIYYDVFQISLHFHIK